jgi:hypothetical protein
MHARDIGRQQQDAFRPGTDPAMCFRNRLLHQALQAVPSNLGAAFSNPGHGEASVLGRESKPRSVTQMAFARNRTGPRFPVKGRFNRRAFDRFSNLPLDRRTAILYY